MYSDKQEVLEGSHDVYRPVFDLDVATFHQGSSHYSVCSDRGDRLSEDLHL